LAFNDKKAKIALSDEVEVNEEFSYAYNPFPTNEKLFLSYGFYEKNNPFSSTIIKINLMKPQINTQKHSFLVKNKLIDQPFDGFFNAPQQNIVIMLTLDKLGLGRWERMFKKKNRVISFLI